MEANQPHADPPLPNGPAVEMPFAPDCTLEPLVTAPRRLGMTVQTSGMRRTAVDSEDDRYKFGSLHRQWVGGRWLQWVASAERL